MNAMMQNEARLYGAMIALLVAVWVMIDASRRGKTGSAAFLWGLGTFLILCLFLPLWLMVRPPLAPTPVGLQDGGNGPDAPEPGSAPSRTPTRVCGHCGKFTVGQYAFCPHCGQPLDV